MHIIEPIQYLQKLISSHNGKTYIFGESLCDIYFLKTNPLYYSIATNLSPLQLSDALHLQTPQSSPSFLLFYNNSAYEYLTTEILPKTLQYPVYIHMHCNIHDFTHHDNTLSIERFAWDFERFYNIKAAENDFTHKKLTLSQSVHKILTQDPIILTQYTRYITRYKLTHSTPIKLTDNSFSKKCWGLELIKTLLSEKPSEIFEQLRLNELLKRTLPELLEGYQVTQNEHHKYDVYYHSLYSCDAAPQNNFTIRLAALLHDIGKPRAKKKITTLNTQKNVFYNHENIGAKMTSKILKRLSYSQNTKEYITQLVRLHMFHYTPDWTDNAIRRFIRTTQKYLNDLLLLREADRVGSGKRTGLSPAIHKLQQRITHITIQDNAPKVTDLAINGHDLMKHLELQEGPLIGTLFKYLLQCTLNNPSHNNNETLLELASNWLQKHNFTHK